MAAKINLDNIAATAAITIQLIKDYSMYDSEIISSNGTIFQSTDTSTTLTLKVYKGIEDISNKILDIEWSKFYFQDDELIEDIPWGTDKKNKAKVVLLKDDINEKCIIQANGYSTIEGKRELVTTARITIIKISDIYVSDITPLDPSDKMMWMDTNIVPPTLKIWNEDLGYWVSSGMDVPVVKNLIRNSNFWTEITDYYTIYNSQFIDIPSITTSNNKKWLLLRSKNYNSQGGGVYQEIQYPIVSNSNYIFSFIAYRDTSYYTGSNISIRVESINKSNQSTYLVNTAETLTASIQTIEVPFTTNNDTNKIRVYLCTQDRTYCSFYVTELSLYNSSVYYPWELCPEDVDKQMGTKLDNNRTSVFNTLMDNGNYKALYESNNQYYIRAEYITPELATQADLETLKQTVTQLSTKLTTLQNNYTTLQNSYTTLNNSYTTLNTRYTTLQNSYTTLNTRYTNLQNSYTSLENRVTTLETYINPNNPYQ